ncbi:hypothetical protein COCNU_scaffold069980G000010 [Cocos nucifera]|nr:hypothetical protein [Cocos nucifera]
MPCAAAAIIHGGSPAASAVVKDHLRRRQDGIRRSWSGNDLVGMRRSRSEPQLRCSLSFSRPATASSAPAKLKTSRSVGLFSFIPNSIRSFLFNSEEAHGGMRFVDPEESSEEEVGSETEKRSNWVERIWELRSRWRDRKPKEDEDAAGDGGGEESEEFCRVTYDSGEEAEREEERSEWDRGSFARLLAPVSWTDAKLFSQLAFLCNMAYVIPEIKKVLYSPLGKTYILQPDDKSSPPHPLLPPGAALYILDGKNAAEWGKTKKATVAGALRAFLNSPHPLETLSDPAAYGSDGTILRDHDSSNYLKAMNGLVRQHTKSVVRRTRRQRFYQLWPLLTTPTSRLTGGHHSRMEKSELVNQEVLTTSV